MTQQQIISSPIGTLFNFGIFQGIVDKYNAQWVSFKNILGGITLINVLDSNGINDMRIVSQEDYDKAKAQYFARMIEHVDSLPRHVLA
jgi:hypothetical protein